MKFLMVVTLIGCFTANMAFADETSTICPAMSESSNRVNPKANPAANQPRPATKKGKGSIQ